jgi:hypothetical protein
MSFFSWLASWLDQAKSSRQLVMIYSWRKEMGSIQKKRKITRPAFEGMWLSLQDCFCRFQAALWFAPVAMC